MTMDYRVAVVGGGISGLSAAYYLSRYFADSKFSLELFEARPRLGGVIETVTRDGCLMEGGPDSIFTAKDDALALIRDLGLQSKIVETDSERRRSLIATEGELHPLPPGFVILAPSEILPFASTELLSTKGKLRTLMDLFIGPRFYGDEESVSSFIERRFGREILLKIVQPMVGGIYVGDVEKLSAECTIPQFVELERTSGSVIAGLIGRRSKNLSGNGVSGARYGMFVSLEGGIGALVDALVEATRSEQIQLHTSALVKSINRTESGWALTVEGQAAKQFDSILLCLPSHDLVDLVGDLDADLSEALSEIPCASSIVVNLLYERSQSDYDFDAFGFVVPATEDTSIIAGSFSSVKYKGRCPEDKLMLRAFLGGVLDEEIMNCSDDEIFDRAHRDLARFLNIKGKPVSTWLRRWTHSMPQYQLGHKERVRKISGSMQRLPGLYLAGNSFSGVGIPDCIASARTSAEKLVAFVKAR
ncbi:MAG: protoporphyrinogen oxidase [Cyanobacteriota/Melainabacteria group bacterium]